MTPKFCIAKIRKSPRKIVEHINVVHEHTLKQMATLISTFNEAEVVAIRYLTPEEETVLKSGQNVTF